MHAISLPRHRLGAGATIAALAAAALAATAAGGASHAAAAGSPGAVFAQTNDAAGNQVVAYRRAADGELSLVGRFATGGEGTSRIRLSSQASVVLSPDGRRLFVTNVGSDEISVFKVNADASLRLLDVVPSGGQTPNSVTLRGDLLYVLNNGDDGVGNITGFRLSRHGHLTQLPGSTRELSAPGSNPAQVAFTPDGSSLIVTEKATNRIDTFSVDPQGYAGPANVHPSAGVTPFGLDFARSGEFIVTEAHNGDIGQASASSYRLRPAGNLFTVSAAIGDGRSEVCWTQVSKDGRHVYVTNFGDGTISSYDVTANGAITLRNPVAAVTTFGQLSIRDEGLSRNGRYLYAIDITSQKIHGWTVENDGDLKPIGAFAGLPGTVAGIAVR